MIPILFVFIFLIYFFLKWSHPFWFIQPVYHYYDVFFWGRQKEIRRELPNKNKYYNPRIIFQNSEKTNWEEFQKLISGHFLKNKDNVFSPTVNEIAPYFIGNSLTSYVSLLYKDEYTMKDTLKKLIGTITSRPLTFYGKNEMNIYYIDYLCIDKEERGKKWAPQLIQTHEYNQSHESKTQVSFFRREGIVPLLVPFVKFQSTIFSMVYWQEAKTNHKIIRVNKDNIHILHDFMEQNKKEFMIKNDIGNIIELVKTGNIMIYYTIKDGISNCYFFRKSCTKIDGKEMLILYASVKTCDDFIFSFKCCLSKLMMENDGFVYLCVEELGDNIEISKNLREKTFPTDVVNCGYYFYNYIHKTVNPQKCLILT
jgi:hypothetical protein